MAAVETSTKSQDAIIQTDLSALASASKYSNPNNYRTHSCTRLNALQPNNRNEMRMNTFVLTSYEEKCKEMSEIAKRRALQRLNEKYKSPRSETIAASLVKENEMSGIRPHYIDSMDTKHKLFMQMKSQQTLGEKAIVDGYTQNMRNTSDNQKKHCIIAPFVNDETEKTRMAFDKIKHGRLPSTPRQNTGVRSNTRPDFTIPDTRHQLSPLYTANTVIRPCWFIAKGGRFCRQCVNQLTETLMTRAYNGNDADDGDKSCLKVSEQKKRDKQLTDTYQSCKCGLCTEPVVQTSRVFNQPIPPPNSPCEGHQFDFTVNRSKRYRID